MIVTRWLRTLIEVFRRFIRKEKELIVATIRVEWYSDIE